MLSFGQTWKLHWPCNLSLDTKQPRGGGGGGGDHMGMAGQEGSSPGMLEERDVGGGGGKRSSVECTEYVVADERREKTTGQHEERLAPGWQIVR